MEFELLEKCLEYAKKRRRLLLFGFTCYAAYRIYNSPSAVEKRQRFSRFLAALISLADMLTHSADALGILSKDLKQFLASDSDQIPQSFKQLSKITTSDEFSNTLATITRSSALGISTGYRRQSNSDSDSDSDSDSVGFSDKVMNKLFSNSGAGFASAVVGSFARNTVTALFSEWRDSNSDDSVPKWIEFACEDKCRELLGDFIQLFVSTAVTVYLDKTMHVNTYNDFFSGLTNPKHESKVREMLASLCNGAVETSLRTYFTAANSASISKAKSAYSFEDGFSGDEKGSMRAKKMIPMKRVSHESGWMRTMRSTLAVPGNKKLVLDMTGVVTFETVRSFLEFLLEKLSEGVKTSVDVVQQEVVDKGVEAIRYASGRSSALTAVCLTLCLNILNSPWILVPN